MEGPGTRCPRCQHDNPGAQKFCGECGTRLSAVCPSCRHPNAPGQKFCGECGTPIEGSSTAGRFAAPDTYTPKHLAERILTSKAALEGERKQVTVLFADLKGSMELLADRDPEEARKLLDPVLDHMMEAVHRYEGTVNQVMGDGIMALFGAPLAHEDHAVRACYAALRMQETVKRYAEGVRRTEGVLIQIRVGLNSGEVVVRSIGSDLHMDYTAVGQTTHLAARMEQFAAPGSTLVTADTLRLAEGFVQVRPLGPMAVKGLGEPVEVFELTGTGAVRSRLQAAAARGLSRFVGRDAEIEALRRALEQARQGRGQVAAVVGEPGVGKSRLFFELTHSHRVDGWLVLESGSVSYGKATGYLPVIDLLKGYFKVSDRDTHRDIREKVTGKLLTLDRALEPALPALLALLDVPVDDPQWDALEPAQRRQRTLEAVKRLLLRENQSQPLLVVFEDLHWIDGETQALLDSLIESLPTARLLLLVNYRPEYTHPWGSKTYYTQLRLDTLPPESAREMLHALLGGDRSVEPLQPLLAARTGGNPLFLEESVRSLVETGVLAGERGAYRLARPLDTIHVPVTVQAILAARIDRLPPEEKGLLQSAAVIGKDVPFALLQAIADQSEDALRQCLGHLQAAEFLYEVALFPDLEYTFKHALTHEVAHGSLLQERRKALDLRILDAIERLYSDRIEEQVERLAHHAVRAQAWERAAAYCRRAGVRASARAAMREAVSWLEQALAALDRLPETRQRFEEAVDIRLELRWALFTLGDFEKCFEQLQEADRVAREIGDQRRLGLVANLMSNTFWITGDSAQARRWAEANDAIARALGDPELQAAADYNFARVHLVSGEYRQAEAFLRRIAPPLKDSQDRHSLASLGQRGSNPRGWLGWALAEQGQFAEAVAQCQDAILIAEAIEEPASLCQAWGRLAQVHQVRGDLARALALAERCLALALERDLTHMSRAITWRLGHLKAQVGHPVEGLALLVKALHMMQAAGAGALRPVLLTNIGEALLLNGRPEEARAQTEEALALARQREERGSEALALRCLGDIASRADGGDTAAAERHYQDAISIAESLGMRPLVAHCHAGLATLSRRTGQRAEVDEHVATATALYREMGMTYWLETLEREMKETP